MSKKTLLVTQIRSAIRRPACQQKILVGLGLTRMGRTRELEDSPSIRGMIHHVKHLVRVEENEGGSLR